MTKVRIHMTGPSTGTVHVDGQELSEVVAVRFEVDVRRETKTHSCVEVTQRFYPEDLEIEGVADATNLANAYLGRQWAKAE